ncbi:MAG: hypothetical protein PHO62_02180 [Sulfurimonas sp.]|uniref:hypothetical protein n=1 Tax=Sulfurimonas sp. TaxID=2022749 RepID=UPI00260C9B2A|nr:hypothetical protein [Sulfurimonas sp.]MDD5372213.1 hypothetical protein [Sulfurimonas sp.]
MNLYTQAHWSKYEDEALLSSLVDGIRLEVLEVKLPRRSPSAISRRALAAGYGTKSVNGIKILYEDAKRRNRKSKVAVNDDRLNYETEEVDEFQSVRADETSTLNISERTNQNFTEVILADSTKNSNKDAFTHLYADIGKLLNSEQYTLKSITVTLKDTVLTVCRGAI